LLIGDNVEELTGLEQLVAQEQVHFALLKVSGILSAFLQDQLHSLHSLFNLLQLLLLQLLLASLLIGVNVVEQTTKESLPVLQQHPPAVSRAIGILNACLQELLHSPWLTTRSTKSSMELF